MIKIKKISILLLMSFFSLPLLWCSSRDLLSEEVVEEIVVADSNEVLVPNPVWEFYDVTGTIVYHNPELDWGDGKEVMKNPLYNVSLRIDTQSPFVQKFFFTSGAYSPFSQDQEYVEVLLGCTEDMLSLTWTVRIADRYIDHNGVLWNSWDYILSSLLWIWSWWGQPQPFPANLSWKIIQAKITRPIDTYHLVTDLPDRWRVGQCIWFSQIQDIQLLDDAKNL